jgi:hypothetical protein
MKKIELNHQALRDLVKFTDPFMHTMEKEEEILGYFRAGELRPPFFIEHGEQYLVFNGNHRVLVAINNKLTIPCQILENLDDVIKAQSDEGDRYRDISMVSPLTFDGVVEDLLKSAELWGHQKPDKYAYL